jgi:hypothetical protein
VTGAVNWIQLPAGRRRRGSADWPVALISGGDYLGSPPSDRDDEEPMAARMPENESNEHHHGI